MSAREHGMPVGLVFCTAAATVLSFAVLSPGRACVYALTADVLIVLSAIDIKRRLIPNRIVLPAALAAFVLNSALYPDRVLEWLFAGLAAAFVLGMPALLGRSWIGMGDAKLALLLGATLGWGVVLAVLLAFLCTFPASLAIILRRGVAARSATLPLAPFLAFAALILMFVPALLGVSS